MTKLPDVPKLLRRTKALAALDLIMSPDWEYRYYSFNTKWSPDQQMASMRDGSGDEWWLVFDAKGWAALKGLAHESPAWSKGRSRLSAALRAVIPTELASFANEPAFRWDETGFAYFCALPSAAWYRANDLVDFAKNWDAGDDELLRLLVSGPEEYAAFVESYFEVSIPISAVEAVFAHRPITQDLCNSLNSKTNLADISPELLDEIGYPSAI